MLVDSHKPLCCSWNRGTICVWRAASINACQWRSSGWCCQWRYNTAGHRVVSICCTYRNRQNYLVLILNSCTAQDMTTLSFRKSFTEVSARSLGADNREVGEIKPVSAKSRRIVSELVADDLIESVREDLGLETSPPEKQARFSKEYVKTWELLYRQRNGFWKDKSVLTILKLTRHWP